MSFPVETVMVCVVFVRSELLALVKAVWRTTSLALYYLHLTPSNVNAGEYAAVSVMSGNCYSLSVAWSLKYRCSLRDAVLADVIVSSMF